MKKIFISEIYRETKISKAGDSYEQVRVIGEDGIEYTSYGSSWNKHWNVGDTIEANYEAKRFGNIVYHNLSDPNFSGKSYAKNNKQDMQSSNPISFKILSDILVELKEIKTLLQTRTIPVTNPDDDLFK